MIDLSRNNRSMTNPSLQCCRVAQIIVVIIDNKQRITIYIVSAALSVVSANPSASLSINRAAQSVDG